MNIRWLWGDFIPTELQVVRDERRRIDQRITENSNQIRYFWLVILGMTLGGTVLIIQVGYRLTQWLHPMWPVVGFSTFNWIVFAVLTILWLVGCIYVLARLYVPVTYRSLRECGYDVCAECGYWLKGLPDETAQCPECGAARESRPPQSRPGESDVID